MMKAKYKYPYKSKKSKTITTKEFSEKYEMYLTLSPIDICLKNGLISKGMHESANYFIFLYSIRFGCSHLRSQISDIYNHDRWKNINSDLRFEEKQNASYKDITIALKNLNSYELILDICVFEKFPSFLRQVRCETSDAELVKFKRGLEEISKLNSRLNSIRRKQRCLLQAR